MTFEFRNGLIWVAIALEYEGTSIDVDRCILDTGSATTAIDIDLIPFNYQKPAIIRRLRGLAGGTQEVVCQSIDRFCIDGIELSPVEVEFGDIASTLGIHGFIGNDILSRFDLTINFRQQEITLVP
jgi:hypothetical protein